MADWTWRDALLSALPGQVGTWARDDYHYEALPSDASIRRATIHPGINQDELRITLDIVTFDVENPPEYESLSYAWGSSDTGVPVLVSSGNGGYSTFHVTPNLEVALRHLRLRDRPRVMWIDAICINQANDAEKGPQVAMMGQIFQLARRVVVWLGLEENESTLCLDKMEDLGTQVEVNYTTVAMQPTHAARDVTLADKNVILPWDSRDLDAAYHLMSRPWFERLWVRQEIHLANDKAIVMCGNREVLWKHFRRAWLCVFFKPTKPHEFRDQFELRMDRIRFFLFQSLSVTVVGLWISLQGSVCSDLRDRIYATLSMLSPGSRQLSIVPDYTKTAQEVYIETVLKQIREEKTFDILQGCQLGANPFGPSWIPAWGGQTDRVVISHLQMASGQLCPDFSCLGQVNPGPGIMRVAAVPVATIQSTRSAPGKLGNLSNYDIFQAVRRVLPDPDSLANPYVAGGTVLEAYMELFAAHLFEKNESPAGPYAMDKKECCETFQEWLSWSDDHIWEEIAAKNQDGTFYKTVMGGILGIAGYMLDRHALVDCSTGHIGRAVPLARPGDQVHVILGCDIPLVLRRLENGQYLIVGAAFIHGFEHGEAVLGKLPENIRHFHLIDESVDSDCYYPRFVNESTNEWSNYDQRLQKLPIDHAAFVEQLEVIPGWKEMICIDTLKGLGVNAQIIHIE